MTFAYRSTTWYYVTMVARKVLPENLSDQNPIELHVIILIIIFSVTFVKRLHTQILNYVSKHNIKPFTLGKIKHCNG